VGKVGEARAKDFLGGLRRNPVIPAVRGPDSALRVALAGEHAAVFVLGGDIFRVLERVVAARRRPAVCINVDLVGGVSADASGLRFLSGRVEGVIPTHRHLVELAKQAGLFTVHRLFAIDSGAVERGVKLIRRAQPHCVEILPALAYPEVPTAYPELSKGPYSPADCSRAKKPSLSYSPQAPPRSRRATRVCGDRWGSHRALTLTRTFEQLKLIVYKAILVA
jgi:glycerol uptake operon antiterminator